MQESNNYIDFEFSIKEHTTMKTALYLDGLQVKDTLHCPLQTSAVLFMLHYCQSEDFRVIFTHRGGKSSDIRSCCNVFRVEDLENIKFTFEEWTSLPSDICNVALPSVHQPSVPLVRCGLCVVLRHIIHKSHRAKPYLQLIDLLGFRQGSMKMCAEVSGWTKLCEVELASSLTELILQLGDMSSVKDTDSNSPSLTVPTDLIKLEGHFVKSCRVHNDHKKRRAELKNLKTFFAKISNPSLPQKRPNDCDSLKGGKNAVTDMMSKMSLSENAVSQDSSLQVVRLNLSEACLHLEAYVPIHHGIRRFTVKKTFKPKLTFDSSDQSIGADFMSTDHISFEKMLQNNDNTNHPNSSSQVNVSLENKPRISVPILETVQHNTSMTQLLAEMSCDQAACLRDAVDQLTIEDIQYLHVYSEGVEMTMADLILFVYLQHLMMSFGHPCGSLFSHLPHIAQWAFHMAGLSTVREACCRMGWSFDAWSTATSHSEMPLCEVHQWLVAPSEDNVDEEEMELSRCARMKHKAIKPEVLQAMKKLEISDVYPVTGTHPLGTQVRVDWAGLPSGVHPREGDVPEKRTQRKCEQLENLVTAVQAVAKPGDIIVDFCSGGGHLGIVAAYLLPKCQVHLVENKEESLMKACSRLASLKLSNVTLYQCNLDYFIGHFQVGVCLHACGSATDMVLQVCLQSHASFVICPCCYGSIQRTHLLSYPRSDKFLKSALTYQDFVTLGHAADQTEVNIALEGQGRHCMQLVDTDRLHYARQWGYDVTLCSLQPLSCTPKNNLLIGTPSLQA